MDEQTLIKLEFDKIRQQLAELTYFEGGRRQALAVTPSSQHDLVRQRLAETEEAMKLLHYGEPGFLGLLKMVEKHLAKAKINGILTAAELADIYHLLRASRLAVKFTGADTCPRLKNICSGIEENGVLEARIFRAVDEDGILRDDASPALKSIRTQINNSRNKIKDYLQSFIRSSSNQKLLQEALITEREGRYVVPVRQEYRSEVKGIVHDESASGATVFIEPLSVVEQNNRIRNLQMEEKREIERILRELSLAVAGFAAELSTNLEILSYLDLIFARARLAYQMDAYLPEVNDKGLIEIERGRHPLLGSHAVPVNVELGRRFDILVITGPNTGGKTVALKTIGLLTVMAMSGLFIPAREKSRVSIFKSIFVDIGDEQSIEQSLSTFSSHMKNIVNIISQVDDKSLVLLDELGAGTDPAEGAALARAILEELKAKGVKAVVTTHQSELKAFAFENERVENACVEFDPVTLMPAYELTIGMPGQSNAFEIAARLGLKDLLVQRARELVPEQEMEMGNMIRQLKESRNRFDSSSKEMDALRKGIIEEKQSFIKERQEFYQERAAILENARREADKYLRNVRREADAAIQEFKQVLKDKEKPPKWHEIEKSRQGLKRLGQEQLTLPETDEAAVADEDIKTGDYVQLLGLGQKGYVLEGPNSQGNVTVQVGIIKLTVSNDQLKKIQSDDDKTIMRGNRSFLEKARNIPAEIDIRGELTEDALLRVEKYLDDAYLVGLPSVRIIHGKGTGALRTAVRNYAKDHRFVKGYHDGLREEGGFGVTVIELK